MDVSRLIEDGFDAVKEYIDRGFSSFVDRLKAVEARHLVKGDKGDPGRDGVDGKDADPETIAKLVETAVAKIPAPKDGAPGERGEKGEAGQNGVDGKDAPALTRDDILAAITSDASIVAAAVADYLKSNPPAAGRDGINGKDGQPGEKGDPGRDGANGAGMASAMIDRDGNLLITLSDGKSIGLGLVVGKDGAPGKDGAAGRDGFGFDDLVAAHDGERTLTLTFVKGEAKKEFAFTVPAVIDRGVWREGQFKAGDGVSWDGSWFVAQEDTDKKPGTPDSGWRLAAKRGRDGGTAFDVAKRAGFKGSEAQWLASLKGPQGPEGRAGRDLTQLGFDGRKS